MRTNSILEMQKVLERVIALAERSGSEKRGCINAAIAAMRESLTLLQRDRRRETRRMSERGGLLPVEFIRGVGMIEQKGEQK